MKSAAITKKNAVQQFLSGDGEMRHRIRQTDWSATAIGSTDQWPQSLRTTLSNLLFSPLPMLLLWGRSRIIFFNDAYSNIPGFGKDHTIILGKQASDHWDILLPITPSIIDDVYDTGEGIESDDLITTDHHDKKSGDTYSTFSYSPVINETGEISGVLVTRIETTAMVLAKKVLENENNFHHLTDSIPAIVWITSPDGSCTYLNKHWYDYTGQTDKEAEGFGWINAIHPDDKEEAGAIFMKANSEQAPFFKTYRLRNKQGNYRWVIDKGSATFGADGHFKGMIGTVVDVHEEKIVEEMLRYRTALLEAHNEASVDGILLVDTKGKIISYNQRFVDIWNMPKEIVDAKDDEAALSFAMTQLVSPGQFIEKVKYLYDHPTETSTDELEYKDGKIIERHGYPVIGDDGTYYAWSWTFRDITQQKNYQKTIEASEQRFQGAVDAVQGILWTNNARGQMEGEQVRWAELTGQDYEEYQGYGWAKAVHPDDAQPTIDAWNQAVQECRTFVFEHRVKMKNGTWGQFSVQAIPLWNSDGSIREWVGVHTDITEQRQTAAALMESEKRFRSLADQSPMIVFIAEPGAVASISYFNKTWLDYTGLPLEETLGLGWHSLIHPDDLYEINEIYAAAFQSMQSYTLPAVRLKRHDDEYRWHIFKGNPRFLPDNQFIGFVGVGFDIHEQKLAEERLKQSEEKFRTMADSIPQLSWMTDAAGWVYWYNQRWYDYTGTTLEEMQGWGWKAVHHPDMIDGVIERFQTAVSTASFWEDVFLLRGKEGEYRWFLSRALPVRNDEGRITGWFGTNTDITDQRNTENALKESEGRFRTLAETLPQLVWMTDEKGVQLYASSRWQEYTGIEPQGWDTWQEILHPDDGPKITQEWRNSIVSGNHYKTEVRLRNKAGEYRWHFVQGEPIFNEKGEIAKWIGAFTDIHDQKESEKKLSALVAQRTLDLERSNEDLQQFAHVASHDLKEPVRKIKIFTGLLQAEMNDALNERGRLYLKKVQSAADRMVSMIDGVLTYSSSDNLQQLIEIIDLDKIMANIEIDLEVAIQQKNAIITRDTLPRIEGVPVLIYQLFYNLINNSLKFVKPEERPQVFISSNIIYKQGKRFIEIKVQDSGIGFEQNQADRIFHTFTRLNSKDKYEGTGLGLSLCKKIVQRHNGTIEATSQGFDGALFTVTLPVKQNDH